MEYELKVERLKTERAIRSSSRQEMMVPWTRLVVLETAFLQEWGSWAGQGPLCTDISLYLEICSKISTIPGAQICMILIYAFVLSQKSLTQKYSFYTKSKDIKVE